MNLRRIPCLLLLSTAVLWAQKPEPPSPEELAAITAGGKQLTEYDRAAHAAIAAVKAIHPEPGKGPLYVGQRTASGWVFWFGRWDESGKKFLTGYSARQDGAPLRFIVTEPEPNEEQPAYLGVAALAMRTAMQQFKTEQKRPYSVAVIPNSTGFYVYIYPSQLKPAVYPLGGDERFSISNNGTAVLETREMHRAIIELDNDQGGAKVVGGSHSHILSDTPEDSDVFHVLRQNPPLPEYVGTKHFIYGVQVDGSIKIVKK